MQGKGISRRSFIGDLSMAALGITIVPRHVLGGPGFRAPSDTLNIAVIGSGGMGIRNAEQLVSENIVALCDIDFGFVDRDLAKYLEDFQKSLEKEPKDEEERKEREERRPRMPKLKEVYSRAKRYNDFRVMLEKEKGIDAVVIATPDHLHATMAATAMRLGKHVYVQKPLTHSIHEARVLRELARETRVATQMGNQGHSSDDARRINEWVQAGVIGPVREVHVWTNRPIWPQGLPRPVPQPAKAGELDWSRWDISPTLASLMGGEYPVPDGIDWDLFLGPAPAVPYHPLYHPFKWRGWVDWGVGALGDMGAHLIDHPFWALDLGYPASVEATSTPWGGGSENPVSYPVAMTAHYRFPARGDRPPVELHWYDGGLMPQRPALLPPEVKLDRTGGVIYVGDKGILMHETYGRKPRLFPEKLAGAAEGVPLILPRVGRSHELNWAEACKGNEAPSCPFEYAAPLTEVMLLGLVALRAGQGTSISYDPVKMEIPNAPEANRYLRREYRKGWSL